MRLAGPLALLAVCSMGASAAPPVKSAFAHLPLRFETTADGALTARDGRYRLLLERGQTTVTVADTRSRRPVSVTTRLAGANPAADPEGESPLAAKANYLSGNDPSQWRAGAPLFERAAYRGVYPGIDLVFHGAGGALEYDFIVQPGSDPKRIALDISGASGLRIEPDGSLAMATPAGEIRWNKPDVYQWNNGVREPVQGAFVRHGRRVTFALGAYDRGRALVIDPTLAYLTYFGGSDDDGTRTIAVDSSGNIYIAGSTFSINLPKTAGSIQPAYRGGSAMSLIGGDAFVAKFTPAGALTYVTYLGGTQDDVAAAIAADSSGNVYVTGYTNSTNFPTTPGSFQPTFQGASISDPIMVVPGGDAFVAKLNPTGTALIYSTFLGGSKDDKGTAITIDAAGNAYVGGVTLSTNFPTTANAYQPNFKGGGGIPDLCDGCGPIVQDGDAFVAKLNPNGTALVFSTYLGGSQDETLSSIALDTSGAVYVAGSTLSADFPTLNGLQSKYAGAAPDNVQPVIKVGDGYVTKFDATGKLVYSTFLGGSRDEMVMGLAVDATGAAYVTGYTSSPDFPVSANAPQKKYGGPNVLSGQKGFLWGDAFAAKISPGGGSLVYCTYLGGNDDDAGWAIAVDPAGAAYVVGFANSLDFFITPDAVQKLFGGSGAIGFADPTGDGFLTKISPDGSSFVYSTYLGGVADDTLTAIALDAKGNAFVAGTTTSTNLQVTAGAVQRTFAGQGTQNETIGDTWLAEFSGMFTVVGNPGLALVSADGSGNGIVSATHANGSAVNVASPAAPGETITILATGLAAAPLPAVTVGGKSATVLSATLGSGGVYQVVVQLPTPLAAGSLPIALSFGGATSNTLTLPVANPNGPVISSVVNGASFLPGIAPNTWITIEGTNLSAVTGDWSQAIVNGQLPASLNGVSVTVGGKPAYIYYTSPVQINAISPDAGAGTLPVTVTNASGTSAPVNAVSQTFSPAFFPVTGNYIVATRQDYTLAFASASTTPAKPGDIIILWGTGFGPTTPPTPVGAEVPPAAYTATNPVTVTIGTASAQVFGTALASGSAALFQVAIQIPAGLADGDYHIVAAVGGVSSPASALITIRN